MARVVYSPGSPIRQGIAFSLSTVLYEPIRCISSHILTVIQTGFRIMLERAD